MEGLLAPRGPGGSVPGQRRALLPARLFEVAQGYLSRQVSAHAVHTPARRRRRGADIEAISRGRVRVEPWNGPGEELPQVHRPSDDVAADEVGVPPFEVGRSCGALGQDEIPEARCEALNLSLDPLRHVEGRAVRDVAVGPDGVLTLWRTRPVEEAMLGEQDERTLRVLSARHGALTRRDLVER